ncbi:quinone-dependent dihydroorotate dehydrogenase [Catellatospora coxensis]|uniref:Dihydroorotate dehydrogenase (quinone) n=1 Tax=Catellatospora coxensis TaxID=310354 RepID=A0A8J3KR50_9ACTN|nr:quinone-dependent dihydroorotate dehydrogenase [Catellatospora coxensis]GIG04708.1 dihydroorotate dehydrogenase (quinone) [Catellatospora coxensis]
MTVFERVVRPRLFRIGGGDAEHAHEWTLRRLAGIARQPAVLGLLKRRYAVERPVDVFGVRFPNAVGLAAGMDKNGVALKAWPALGFGFVEVGTVTALGQPGNERPRLFRLPDSRAIINRMGFNNEGAHALASRLAALGPLGVPLGISLGKSKVTPLEEAVADYRASYDALKSYGDYFAVNVSSPNTPGLRSLQDRDQLDAILAALTEPRASLPDGSAASGGAEPPAAPGAAGGVGQGKPVLVKIAPDLTDHAIAELLEVCLARGVAGLIATNTTLSRDGVARADQGTAAQAGGLSGAPLTERANKVVSFVHGETGGRLPIIGVGGLMSADDAARMFDAGASLVQLYTGFIYHGPALVRAAARRAPEGTR